MNVGFIGIGIMGRGMAKNVIKGGYTVGVYDKYASCDEFPALGAKVSTSSRDIAMQSDVIITMLPNTPHVKEVILGADGVLANAKQGSIIIDMSSIEPQAAKEIYAEAKKKGVAMLDAPVSGGEPKALDGTLAIMAGGDAETFAKAKPILETMGATVTHVGEIGSGNVTKLANQIIVALNIAAVCEAFTLSTKAGVSPEVVFNAIKGGLAGSTVMNAKIPMILERNFKAGGRVATHTKDLTNVLSTSHQLNVSLPLTAMVMEIFQSLICNEMGELDHGAVIRYYENLANVEVRK